MKMIIETFVTIIFLTIAVVIVSQLIGSQMVINGANDFHTNAVQVIEESNFDTQVINQCIEEAADKGYVLDVKVNTESVYQCAACNHMWDSESAQCCPLCESESIYVNHINHEGEVILDYKVELTLLGISREGRLEANAR